MVAQYNNIAMIKNIIFDVDGVLVDSNLTYLEYLKNTYDKYKDIKYEDLSVLFPISPDNGAIKLPSQISADFKVSSWYSYRPLFPDTMAVLLSLKSMGLRLFTLSAARNPEKKLEWISKQFENIFDGFEFSPAGQTKDEALAKMLEKYSLNKDETIFIDDRFQHIRAGIKVGIHTVRMTPKHSLSLPVDLSHIKSFSSMTEFESYIKSLTD